MKVYKLSPRFLRFACPHICLLLPALASDRGEGTLDQSDPVGITVDEIIQNFAAKEKQFKVAREQYTYRQEVIGPDARWRYRRWRVSSKSTTFCSTTVASVSTGGICAAVDARRIRMTKEDFDDINHRMPFVLTSDEIGEYQILYVGKQKEDELGTYVFDIAPKQIEKNKRYFQGRIWVDDHDFQIVKTYGKNVPDIGVGKKGRAGKPLPKLHHLAAADRQPVLVSGLHQGRRRPALLLRRRARRAEGEIQQLQALRLQVEDHLRRPRDHQGPAAVHTAAWCQHNAAQAIRLFALC